MPGEYLLDGDIGFLGFDSRNNPASLPAGFISESRNMRLDRGVASVRKGCRKYAEIQIAGPEAKVVGSGSYVDSNGQEIFIVLSHDFNEDSTYLYLFNPDTQAVDVPPYNTPFSTPINITADTGVRITSDEGVSIVHAMGQVFISRGLNARPIRWDMQTTFTVLPTNSGDGHEFPNCKKLMYFQNRLVALGAHHASTEPSDGRYTVSVSHFLDWKKWDALDAFRINQGGNDETVTVVPWTMNEFIVMMRSSAFYVNIGTNRYLSGQPLSTDAALLTLSTDIGCLAEKTAIQVSNGVMFLSDNGVYFMQPNPTGNEGVKLLTLAEPLSAPINDIIGKINKQIANKSVAAYWNNRYYLAVPVDSEQILITGDTKGLSENQARPDGSLAWGEYVNASGNGEEVPFWNISMYVPLFDVKDKFTLNAGDSVEVDGIVFNDANNNKKIVTGVHIVRSIENAYDKSGAFTGYIVDIKVATLAPYINTLGTSNELKITKIATSNNSILVYNFILKAWETVDDYPNHVDFMNLHIGKKDTRRRLYGIDANEGVLLLEEEPADQVGPFTGNPMLTTLVESGEFVGKTGFWLDDSAILRVDKPPFRPIQGMMTTRRYSFNSSKDKRYSSVETDFSAPPGTNITTTAVANNPDSETKVDIYVSQVSEDTVRRSAVRKIATGIQIRYSTLNSNPTIRSVNIVASTVGKNNQSKY